MTKNPISVDLHDTASAAEKIMNAKGIHHLPVIDGKKIYGLISDRDISVARRSNKDKQFDGKVLVKEICLDAPYTCEESEALDAVAARMSAKKAEAVVVVRAGVPVGIFTTNDACRLLARSLRNELHSQPGFWERLLGD
jgi:CBS domain-containing protein